MTHTLAQCAIVEISNDCYAIVTGETGETFAGQIQGISAANAHFIVHAVNCHEELVDLLKKVSAYLFYANDQDAGQLKIVVASAIAKAEEGE